MLQLGPAAPPPRRIGGYLWSRMWDHHWAYENQGRLYAHCPHVYPPEEEE